MKKWIFLILIKEFKHVKEIIKEMLNHECQKTTVEHYLDPRILAAWCDANKISKDQLRQSFYMSEDWTLNSMKSYKNFKFHLFK